MDGVELLGVDVAQLINRLSDDVDNTAKGAFANWHANRRACVNDFLSTDQPLGGIHRNRADSTFSQMLSDLKHKAEIEIRDLKRVHDWRQSAIELDVNDGTNDL